ncbi:MAG: tripartite tricarboxylate transporter substrate binding protein [Alphaproteobacteria bacterium]|nr:tripartite tricarboxylate transporter substrate binding protein [Alphaproteobacteria bacterium]
MPPGPTRRAALGLPLVGLALPGVAWAAADDYPNRPIHLAVGFAPGGGADITGRVVGAKLSQMLGQQILVENRTGASGIIAAEFVAKAPPDGYTLGVDTSAHAFNPSLYRKLPYDSEKDFTPISLVLRGPNVLLVHPDFPVHTVQDLIAMAKAKPGQLSYASSGNGTAQTMSAELFKQMAGVDIVAIQYRGGAPALVDVSAGQVPLMFGYISSSFPYIQDKRLRAVAVTSEKRWPTLPDVPTVAESGVPGYSVYEWNGIVGPAGLPAPILARLHDAIVEALNTDEVKDRLSALGAELVGDTPEEYGAFIKAEIAKWSEVIKQAGIHSD